MSEIEKSFSQILASQMNEAVTKWASKEMDRMQEQFIKEFNVYRQKVIAESVIF
jgi:hypothetical protein